MTRTKRLIAGVVALSLFAAVVAAASGGTADMKSDLRQLKKTVDDLEGIVAPLRGLDDTVDNLKDAVAPLRGLDGTVDNLKDAIAPLKGLDGTVDNLKDAIAPLKGLNDTVGDLQKTVAPLAQLPTEVQTLREDLDDKVTTWTNWLIGLYVTIIGALVSVIVVGVSRWMRSEAGSNG